MEQIQISIITLSFDSREYTEKFVESIRSNTKLNYELIIVDNGSEKKTQEWIEKNSDRCIINNTNKGFARGFNAGIKIASGEYIMMANNDTEFPPNWDINLIENFSLYDKVGMVSPVYTKGAGTIALRKSIGKNQILLQKFGKYPSGVGYLSKRSFINNIIGGWSEDYYLASGEDADYCYKIWSKNYDIIVDERVLIKHEGKVTTKTKIYKWKKLWKKNARLFRKKWAFYYYFKYFARIYVKYRYDR